MPSNQWFGGIFLLPAPRNRKGAWQPLGNRLTESQAMWGRGRLLTFISAEIGAVYPSNGKTAPSGAETPAMSV
jgi:hypothetical protein